MRLIGHSLRHGTVVLAGQCNVYKFYFGRAAGLRRIELSGNISAQQSAIWREYVLPARSIPFGISSARGVVATSDDSYVIEQFLWERYEAALTSNVRIGADRLLSEPRRQLFKNFLGLPQHVLQCAQTSLRKLDLVGGGSHGDVHPGNVVFIDNRLFLIDWTMFRPDASVLFDILHLVIRGICAARSVGWPSALAFAGKDWDAACARANLSALDAKTYYAAERIDCELIQKNACGRKPNVSKYRDVFNTLLAAN